MGFLLATFQRNVSPWSSPDFSECAPVACQEPKLFRSQLFSNARFLFSFGGFLNKHGQLQKGTKAGQFCVGPWDLVGSLAPGFGRPATAAPNAALSLRPL